MDTLIPEAKWDAVQQALQTTFNTTTIDALQLLAGGLSSALVYKMTIDGQPYLLRLMMATDELRDPARYITCMQHAATAGIAPKVYYANVEGALVITDFIATQARLSEYATPEKRLRLLAQTVKAIHALPRFPSLVNFLDGVDLFIEQFHASALLPASATAEHFRAYAAIQQVYPRHDPDLVASHNDLNPGNMLFDGRKLWIIDWEAAFCNDRYVDLAIAAKPFVSTAAEETVYLQSYFGDTLDAYKSARYFLMQQVCHMYYAMIMLKFAAAQKPPHITADPNMATGRLRALHDQIGAGAVSLATYEGKVGYGKTLLNEALHNMLTPQFAVAVQTVAAG
ncbi:MAG: phosphotransferase [Caldilineaceae bacterium]